MGKYDRLTRWLERQLGDRIEVSFEDIEDADKIGVQLPESAKAYREWWANEVNPKTRHFQCRAWTEAGWRVESVDLAAEVVIFVRTRK
jgi:hypothetical protein